MSATSHSKRTVMQLVLRLVFEVLPTAAISWWTLQLLNKSFTSLDTSEGWQTIWLTAGLTISYGLYFFRVRPLFTFVALAILYWGVGKIIGHLPGEFDMFRYTALFRSYALLFFVGWSFGLVLAAPRPKFIRNLSGSKWTQRYAIILIVGLLLLVTIISVADTSELSVNYLLGALLPIVGYTFYMFMLAPQLSDMQELNTKKTINLSLRLIAFLAMIFIVFFAVTKKLHSKLVATEYELVQMGKNDKGKEGDKNYDERKGLLERGNRGQKPQDGKDKGGQNNDDGEDGYKLKDSMSMSDRMSQADYIMFCSKLKNYFPDGSPKPLYFVYHYLTKYDPVKETFTRDTAVPYFDELNIDPSTLPMYRSRSDSTVIKNSLATKKRKTVDAEVYVSSNTWKHALLAPATPYSVQTIPVDSSFKKLFRSAYKVKCYTSELNNAYFVYNPSGNPQLEGYQEERYDELRSVENYAGTDTAFFEYYTQMPKGALYDSITALAQRITKNATTPVDKVIAIRDYFLQRDKEGNRVFRYTLTPGPPSDPNIPNATMLSNFLFRTHAGYCTYYAGASLFLLRAVGIPSRFTTGFATIDRSDKNKGWYWFYASQAHAWTQVYFPGYGWLDFDMTIGNEDQRESPQPDGTPPLPPPEPWLVLIGKAETKADLKAKRLDMSFDHLIFFNDDYRLESNTTRTIDASVCRVLYDKKDTTLAAIQPGDSIVVISYDDAAKQVPQPRSDLSIDEQLKSFPKPVIADEIHIKPREQKSKTEEEKKQQPKAEEKELTWQQILLRVSIVVAGVVWLLFMLPLFWLWGLMLRIGFARHPKTEADRAYRLALYHFHMSGVERGTETAKQYAQEKVDPKLQAGFGPFMDMYLRLKYGNGQLLPDDPAAIRRFRNSIRSAARRNGGFFGVLFSYLNLSRASRFFRRRDEQHEA